MKLSIALVCLVFLTACAPPPSISQEDVSTAIPASITRTNPAVTSAAGTTPVLSATETLQPTPFAPSTPQVAAGEAHTCLLDRSGNVWCWGWNIYGQAGSEPSQSVWPPVQLPLTGITSISSGAYHSCAIDGAGRLFCWGRNNQGQLGNENLNDSSIPVEVTALSGETIAAVSCGSFHTCAVNTSGQAWCWGSNRDGKLGNGEAGGVYKQPVPVIGELPALVSIAAGATFTCAADVHGVAWCWGDGSFGETGSKTMQSNPLPVQVSGVNNVKSLSAGWAHLCALSSDGNAACWGKNFAGELGNSSNIPRSLPAPITGLSGKQPLRILSVGGRTSCALTEAGFLLCWGRNDAGQAGSAARVDTLLPAQVNGIPGNIISLAVGGSHTCALTDTGDLYCWGDNDLGQLGAAGVKDSSAPILISGME